MTAAAPMAPPATMTSSELREWLRVRYPAPEWACFDELANGTGFGKDRSADFVAFNTYPSKGHLSVAVEIKVSRSDFARELTQPAKRAWLEECFAECWFVAPKGVIRPEELPARWGLMEPRGQTLRAVRRASQDSSKCLNDAVVVSIVRRFAELERRRADAQERWGEFLGRRLGTDDLLRLAAKFALRVDHTARSEVARLRDEQDGRTKARRERANTEYRLRQAIHKIIGWGKTEAELMEWIAAHGAIENARAIAEQLRAAADLLAPRTDGPSDGGHGG